MMYCQHAISVSDSSQIGGVRRWAQRIAVESGLNETDCGKSAIVATELATNLSRYADGGEILLRSFDIGGVSGIEILAIDRGPGLANVPRSLQDGYSSGGTAGEGSVQRLSSEFDIFSTQPGGTVVFSRIQTSRPLIPTAQFEWGVVNRPSPGKRFRATLGELLGKAINYRF